MAVVIKNQNGRVICLIGTDFEKYFLTGGISIMGRISIGGSKCILNNDLNPLNSDLSTRIGSFLSQKSKKTSKPQTTD